MRKPGKEIQLNNTLQVETWRQRLVTENRVQSKRDAEKIKELEKQLESKNSYFYNFLSEDKQKEKQDEEEKAKHDFAYDTLKEKEAIAEKADGMYWQKLAKDSLWGKQLKNRDEPKKGQSAPMTQNQELGWREPIDTFNFGYQRSGNVGKLFQDQGHLS